MHLRIFYCANLQRNRKIAKTSFEQFIPNYQSFSRDLLVNLITTSIHHHTSQHSIHLLIREGNPAALPNPNSMPRLGIFYYPPSKHYQQTQSISLSLLMEATSVQDMNFDDQSSGFSCSTNDKILKFSFLAKILQESYPKTSPEHIMLRPIKVSRTSDRSNESEQTSAKNILKRTIIRETSNTFGEKVRENFLMKGKMLNGSKKPLQNQMQSFLLCLNQRINREAQRNEKISELPSLSKQDFETAESTSDKKMHYQEIFKNLRQLRLKKPDIAESPPPPKVSEKYRRRSQIEKKDPSQTISYNLQSSKQTGERPSIVKLPFPHVKTTKDITFKRGYQTYDQQAFDFLQKYRQNMKQNYQKLQKNQEITANAYMVIDYTTLTPISGRNANQQIEIASLTKIMTCYLCLLICQKYKIDVFTYSIRVGDKAAETPGTTAQLQTGDNLTIYELLLGLMLPSGNDASVAIAQTMGKIIQRHRKKQTRRTFYEIFIAHMNFYSKELKLDQTWNNSSGLSLNPNYSTPQAIVMLTALAIKNPIFHKIVNTKSHEIDIKNERYGLNRKIVWKNTNKLLESGWQGVKTGTTQNAGHCLMARRDNLLICVFDCQSLNRRFSQCVKLYDKYRSYASI